jgi:hypothetical protein
MADPKTSVASYLASGGLVIFGLSANDFAVLVGLVFAAATFVINWVYKHKHLKIIERRAGLTPSKEDEL